MSEAFSNDKPRFKTLGLGLSVSENALFVNSALFPSDFKKKLSLMNEAFLWNNNKQNKKQTKKQTKLKKTTNEKNNDSTSKKGPRQEGQRVNEL